MQLNVISIMGSRIQYKNYLLVMMLIIGIISLFDRFVFAMVLEPIKQDLGLSDSQLGLMSGIAFSAFYAVAGIPIARWADRGNRISLVTFTMSLLGIMVALCGMVTNFFQLLLVRAGVAVGEAGSMPTAQSLLAEYFDRVERPKAMAIYSMFYPLSMIVGYLVGGWMVEHYGWRYTFIIMGVPPVLIALIAKFTLIEPRTDCKKTQQKPSLFAVFQILWKKRTFRHLLMCFCLAYFFLMGTGQWLATFFIRNHGMTPAELGAWLALSWGVFGVIGNYLGGYVATRFAAGNEKRQMRALSVVFILLGLASAGSYLAKDQYVALAFVALSAFLSTLPNGPILSAIQNLVSDHMRSVTLALLLLVANLVGLGLGPLAIGVLSDCLTAFGDESLRYALVFSTPGVLWAAVHFWQAGSHINGEITS